MMSKQILNRWEIKIQSGGNGRIKRSMPTLFMFSVASGDRLLAMLTFFSAALAVAMLWRGLTTALEAVSFITGALCVWLTVRENVWNFPIGMLNVGTFFVVFYRAGLLADTGLQVIYFVLGAIGWYLWLFGGANRSALRITSAPLGRAVSVSLTAVVLWAGLFLFLRRFAGASPLWDSLTTALCLAAQWLTDRKHWQSWVCWLAADVVYVPLYASKFLYLTSALYSLFFCMAVIGLVRWYRLANID